MNLQDIIAQAGGLESIAAQVGISPSQAQAGIGALLPAVLGGFKKNAEATGGAGGMLDMIQGLGGGGLLDNVLGAGPSDVDAGNNVLGQIFGSKDVSRVVADHAAGQSGLDSSILKKLLPLVAMLAAGYMAKQAGGSGASAGEGGLGGMLGGLLGGGQGGGLGGLLGGLLGGGQAAPAGAGAGGGALGGLGSMLDLDGDGNPLDDILGMAGKAFGR